MKNRGQELSALRRQVRDRLRSLPDLDELLFRLVRQVPFGKVTTYGDIGRSIGDRLASKWVGQRLLNHDHSIDCLCHRVVRAGGVLGNFVTKDPSEKQHLLEEEGIDFENGKASLEKFGFYDFDTTSPLTELRAIQDQLAVFAESDSERSVRASEVRYVGGVDLSYNGLRAVGALAIFDLQTGQIIDSLHIERQIQFPYISTYLAFRELPVLLDVLDAAERSDLRFDVILVDGSGILHPRKTGIATMLGMIADCSTIGVTKKSLVGAIKADKLAIQDSQPISLDGIVAGHAILPSATTKNPLYVSPGFRVGVDDAKQIVLECFQTHRLPEPIFWADKISRHVAKGLSR